MTVIADNTVTETPAPTMRFDVTDPVTGQVIGSAPTQKGKSNRHRNWWSSWCSS